MNPATIRAAAKLNLIRILSSHPDGLSLEELQKITGHKSISELKNELGELYMIEMYPYSPQDCVDIDFDGEKVKITLPLAVDKVLPLSPEEWILLREIVRNKKTTTTNEESQIADQILSKIDSIIPSGTWEPNAKIRDSLQSAIQTKRIIKIQYWKRDRDQKESRIVQPWILWEENDNYLLAFDLEKKAFRSFRLDCILSVEKTEKESIVLPDEAKDWLDGFRQLVSLEKNKEEQFATIYLTDSSAFHLGLKLPLKDLQKTIAYENENYFLYEVPIREEKWFINSILGYGKSAMIQSPLALKDKILARIKEATTALA